MCLCENVRGEKSWNLNFLPRLWRWRAEKCTYVSKNPIEMTYFTHSNAIAISLSNSPLSIPSPDLEPSSE